MAPAGQEEERPGDEPEGIHYFDFSDPFGPAEEDTDPFASEDPAGHGAADAAEPPKTKKGRAPQPEDEASSFDAFAFALTGRPGSTAPAAGPMAGEEPPEETDVTFSTLASWVETEEHAAVRRTQFAATFDAARADAERPFLAVALRMAAGVPAAHRFPVVEQGLRSALHHGDVLLADPERLRLVAVLPGRSADAARALCLHLMAYLRERIPDAGEVGRAIEVLAAPDGHPFQRAADFLAATFDEPARR